MEYFYEAGFVSRGSVFWSENNPLLKKEQTPVRVDFLTGAANSRAFYEMAGIEISRSDRSRGQFPLAYLDFDNVKKVYDPGGPSQGRSCGQLLKW